MVSCVVITGDKPLSIVWTKDGEVIPPDLGIQVQVNNLVMMERIVCGWMSGRGFYGSVRTLNPQNTNKKDQLKQK